MADDAATTDDGAAKVAALVAAHRFAMMTTRDPDGTLVSRPMTLQETEFDGDLWFFAERGSRKLAHLAADPQVNVTVGSGASWVSLTGTCIAVENPERKRELWNAGVDAWFPQGPDDDSVVLLKVVAESAEYWDTPGGRLATLVSFAKATLTGQRYDGGENERVEL